MPRSVLLFLALLPLLALSMCHAALEFVFSGETAQVSRILGVDASAPAFRTPGIPCLSAMI